MNDKQRRFVDEYVIDLNQTQAAIRAGYSEKTNYYVYELVDPKTELPFYIGKGKGNRIKQHVKNALAGKIDNAEKHKRIKPYEVWLKTATIEQKKSMYENMGKLHQCI